MRRLPCILELLITGSFQYSKGLTILPLNYIGSTFLGAFYLERAILGIRLLSLRLQGAIQ